MIHFQFQNWQPLNRWKQDPIGRRRVVSSVTVPSVVFAILMTLFWSALIPSAGLGAQLPHNDPTTMIIEVGKLEQKLFARKLPKSELLSLLGQLNDSKKRKDVVAEIVERGAACQLDICEYALQVKDLEIVEVCAEIVSQLDDDWQTTPDGRRYLGLVKGNVDTLFPGAWRRFRADATDQAACAIILATPPNSAWDWIEKYHRVEDERHEEKMKKAKYRKTSPSEIGQRLYVLLRVRELSPDEFAAKKLWQYSLSGGVSHVFPAHRHSRSAGDSYRQVGHVLLKRFEGDLPIWDFHGKHVFRGRFFPRQFQVFRADTRHSKSDSGKVVQLIHFDRTIYGPYALDKGRQNVPPTPGELATKMFRQLTGPGSRITGHRVTPKSIPIVALSEEHHKEFHYHTMSNFNANVVPWWWKNFVSSSNAKKMAFTTPGSRAKAPPILNDEVAIGLAPSGETLDLPLPSDDAPSFVLLPPRMGRKSESHQVAADLAVDRFGEELEKLSAQIVDRNNLKSIFDERSRNKTFEPITSFDAFVRLQVSNDELEPRAKVSVIGLSTGSALASGEFQWPIQESDLKRIQSMFKKSLSKIRKPDKKRIRVRVMSAQEPAVLRMRPLAEKLNSSIDRALRKDKKLLVVDHIEAGSAAEEALFLMAGLARRPGGRVFAPASDATIVFEFNELDSSGKSFEKTTVAVWATLRIPGQADRSETFSNVVGQFESQLIPLVAQQVVEGLYAVAPGGGQSASLEMSARKEQAVNELAAIKRINPKLSKLEIAREKRRLAQAALKLDPTNADAALLLMLGNSAVISASPGLDKLTRDRLSKEGLELVVGNYKKHIFNPEKFAEIRSATYSYLRGLPATDSPALRRRYCYAILEVAALDLKRPLLKISGASGKMIKRAIEGLQEERESPDELAKRMVGFVDQVEQLQKQLDGLLAVPQDNSNYMQRQNISEGWRLMGNLREEVMFVCCQLKLVDQYDRLLPGVKADWEYRAPVPWQVKSRLKDMESLGDTKRLAAFDSWAKSKKFGEKRKEAREKNPIQFIPMRWPKLNVYAGSKTELVQTESFEVEASGGNSVFPLCKTKNRLYFISTDAKRIGWNSITIGLVDGNSLNSNQRLGYYSLKDGNPTGPVKYIPLPPEVIGQAILGCAANSKTLVIGTQGNYKSLVSGLYVLDLKKEEWEFIGVEKGLPSQWITSMKLISNDRVLCTGSMRHETRPGDKKYTIPRDTVFTFDLKRKTVNQYRIKGRMAPPRRLTCVTEQNGVVYAHGVYALWPDLLSGHAERVVPFPLSGKAINDRVYANSSDACFFHNHIYFSNSSGLHQMRLDGAVIRSWKRESKRDPSPLNHRFFEPSLVALPECPSPESWCVLPVGDLLLSFSPDGTQVTGYDSNKSLWYGPVEIPRSVYAIGDGKTCWLGGKSIHRMRVSDLMSAAKKSGRVLTEQEYLERQRRLAAKLPLVKQAKVAFAQRRFSDSKRLLDQAIAETPKDPYAYLMMGVLLDTWGMNRIDEASAAYLKVEELEVIVETKYSAATLNMKMLERSGQTKEASLAAQKILETYSPIGNLARQRIHNIATRKQN